MARFSLQSDYVSGTQQADGSYAIAQAASALSGGTDRGGSITTGGTAQDVAPANAVRLSMTFQNTSDTAMWLSESGTTAAVGTGYSVGPGVAVNISTNKRISVYCASAGKTFASTES